MSETATANPPSSFPWTGLLRWQPFQIDALGLITLLGAEEVNAAVGRLVRSHWLEYLPLLGAYVIANQRFREKEAGYSVYNISRGIHTTDLASWFSRWIKAQEFEQTGSFVRWTYEKRRDTPLERFGGIALSVLSLGFLTAMTVLSYDWYGFANALLMAASVIVRHYMVSSLRDSIDRHVEDRVKGQLKSERAPNATAQYTHPLNEGWLGSSPCKVLIITSDARAVTMLIPSELLRPPSSFIANLAPGKNQRLWYSVARWSGWIAFAVQVVTIGMADLATQLVTVFLLVVPTVLHVNKLGCDDSQWGHTIRNIGFQETSLRNWRKRIHEEEKGVPTPESSRLGDGQFRLRYVCWIGKYLKAEVFDWPRSHNYTFDGSDPAQLQPVRNPRGELSQKRQHLYAWLQLDRQELESMDKWDLFPHKRDENAHRWLNEFLAGAAYIKSLSQIPHYQTITTLTGRTERPSTRGEQEVLVTSINTDTYGSRDHDDDSLPVEPSASTPLEPVTAQSRRPELSADLPPPPYSSAMYVSQGPQTRPRERRQSAPVVFASPRPSVGVGADAGAVFSGRADRDATNTGTIPQPRDEARASSGAIYEGRGGLGTPNVRSSPPSGLDWLRMRHGRDIRD